LISACQKHLSPSVENLGARQTKKVIGCVAAYVKAPVAEHTEEAGPALPESPDSKSNKDNASQAQENEQDSHNIHTHTLRLNPTLH
jgi:hypothetical protein